MDILNSSFFFKFSDFQNMKDLWKNNSQILELTRRQNLNKRGKEKDKLKKKMHYLYIRSPLYPQILWMSVFHRNKEKTHMRSLLYPHNTCLTWEGKLSFTYSLPTKILVGKSWFVHTSFFHSIETVLIKD